MFESYSVPSPTFTRPTAPSLLAFVLLYFFISFKIHALFVLPKYSWICNILLTQVGLHSSRKLPSHSQHLRKVKTPHQIMGVCVFNSLLYAEICFDLACVSLLHVVPTVMSFYQNLLCCVQRTVSL